MIRIDETDDLNIIKNNETLNDKLALEGKIRQRAQQIYEERCINGVAGTAELDWEQAKKELLS